MSPAQCPEGAGAFTTMTCQGGGFVQKRLDPRHPAGDRFAAAMCSGGPTGMHRYLDTLRAAGVALPPDLTVMAEPGRPEGDTIGVRHRWVPGPCLPRLAAADPDRLTAAVATVGRWVLDLDRQDARLDTNLANFCLDASGQVAAVDVLPPLVPSLCPAPRDRFDELFLSLCFDTPVTLTALVGYAARQLLYRAGRQDTDPSSALAFLTVADELLHAAGPPDDRWSTRWFRARVVLALRALRAATPAETVHAFFALTSVRTLRRHDEPDRAARIAHVDRLTRELELL